MQTSTLSAAECIVAMKALHNRLGELEAYRRGPSLDSELDDLCNAIHAYAEADGITDPDAAIYNMVDHRYDDLVSGLAA